MIQHTSNQLTTNWVLTTASYRNTCVSLAVSVHSVVFHSILHQKRQGGLPFVDTSQPKIARISDLFNRACFNW